MCTPVRDEHEIDKVIYMISRRLSSQGFTLVELMVTIAVVAILAMIAAPSFTETIRKNQLVGDTRDFIDLLVEARSEAIFKQQNRIIALDNSVAYKQWSETDKKITKESGAVSVTFNRLGQSTAVADECFIFEHKSDATLKSYVVVQKDGVIFYDKTATSCPV